MRPVTLPAGDDGPPCLPTELARGDALTEVHGPVLTANAPDLAQREPAGWEAPFLFGSVGAGRGRGEHPKAGDTQQGAGIHLRVRAGKVLGWM